MSELKQDLITGGFTGRFGNNLWQMAAAISLATKHSVPYSFQFPSEDGILAKYFSHLAQIHIVDADRTYYNEDVYEYREIPYSGGTLCLCGFFQSYKYLEGYRQIILDAFKFDWQLIKDRVSIHVRRGDYVVGTPFEPVTIEYISKAISFFNERNYFNFVVFSDDMNWCKENVSQQQFKNCIFNYSEGRDEFEDIVYMSSCEHNVIANSSFSFWAGWLNRNPDKIVVAPTKWFNGVNKDLLPPEWIKIEA